MKNFIAISLLVLIVVAAVVWIVGMVGGVVVPLFGGIRAERIGEILCLAGMCGEVLLYAFGLVFHTVNRTGAGKSLSEQSFKGFGSEKRYGNRK